mgnify:CR=1 FL=1
MVIVGSVSEPVVCSSVGPVVVFGLPFSSMSCCGPWSSWQFLVFFLLWVVLLVTSPRPVPWLVSRLDQSLRVRSTWWTVVPILIPPVRLTSPQSCLRVWSRLLPRSPLLFLRLYFLWRWFRCRSGSRVWRSIHTSAVLYGPLVVWHLGWSGCDG